MSAQEMLTGLAFGESPRWSDGRLWFANWGTHEIVATDLDGRSEVTGTVTVDLPYSIDWLPDGQLLVLAGPDAVLLREEASGERVVHADLSSLASGFNEIVVDGRGNAYVNGGDFDAEGGFPPGIVALVRPDGTATRVGRRHPLRQRDGDHPGRLDPDRGRVLRPPAVGVRHRRRRDAVRATGLADLGEGTPDGICLDADGAVWYADVPNQCCVRVAEGGAVLSRVELDRGGFACMLGGPDGRTLFILASVFAGFAQMDLSSRNGVLLTVEAPAPAAGFPRSDRSTAT